MGKEIRGSHLTDVRSEMQGPTCYQCMRHERRAANLVRPREREESWWQRQREREFKQRERGGERQNLEPRATHWGKQRLFIHQGGGGETSRERELVEILSIIGSLFI